MNLFNDGQPGPESGLYPLGSHPKFPQCPCGSKFARRTPVGGQDTVRCAACGKHLYNAPKTETGRAVRTVSTVHAALRSGKRERVLERGNYQCELCGKRGTPEHPLHVGHLLSVADGVREGLTEDVIHHEENLAAMCDECNLGIKDRTVSLRLVLAILMVRTKRKVQETDRERGR